MKSDIVFLHPDLGVGGAERLVVDAALSLKKHGHEVSFVTSHHSKEHCFEETRDGTLPVTVVGDWLPRNIFGKFYALCAYIRMVYCSLYIVFFMSPKLVFCDLISACIPLLHITVKKVVFYCHFPDQLLSKKGNFFKSVYRIPLDWIEEKTTGCADTLFVNSKFTRSVFKSTFKSLKKTPDILYPSIHTDYFDKITDFSLAFLEPPLPNEACVFLSINRYERKKNVELAIEALSKVETLITKEDWNKVRLVIAGGYDTRVDENIEYYRELVKLAESQGMSGKVYFLKSPSNSEKVALLKSCTCVIYTPHNEHFGIVPLEAMYCRKPVIAVNSGGPTETIANTETGFLCEMDSGEFAVAMSKIINNRSEAKRIGEAGYNRFCEKFSFSAFSENLNIAITKSLAEI